MSAWNQNYNLSMESKWSTPLPSHRMEHDLTLLPMASGVGVMRELSLMSVFSTHMPPQTETHSSQPATGNARLKKRAYDQRVREVEHASFTPLVLSATGGMANEATHFYKRLASCLANKWDHTYSSTMSWLRCRLTFSLLRSAIQCIRGARSSCGHACKSVPPIDLVSSETLLPQNY